MAHEFSTTKVSATKATMRDNRLPGRREPRFIYAHSPFNWEFRGNEWLPRLTKIPLSNGVNGCRPGPGGHQSVITQLRAQGSTPIDEEGKIWITGPDGELVEDYGYLCEADGRGGPTYYDAWTHPIVVGSGSTAVVDYTTGYDRAGWTAWRRSLLAEGRISPPSPAVVEQLIRRQERRANRRIGESHDGNPHIQAHVATELSKAEAMRQALRGPSSKPQPEPEPIPKPRKVSRGT